MTRKGKFISIEGIEGAGKSTVIAHVVEFLQQQGMSVVCTREPGGTLLAEQWREMLLNAQGNERITAEAELCLFSACRAQHVAHTIIPALEKGAWVVSDRYIDASFAYQGAGRGLDTDIIATLVSFTTQSLLPEKTLLLDVPVEVGMGRLAQETQEKDRIEQEAHDFFRRIRAAYRQRAEQDRKRFTVLDASESAEQVKAEAILAIQALIS